MYLFKAIPVFLTTSLAALLVSGAPASSHPHVFAEARLDVTVADDRSVTSLRHLWRFDSLFSSTVLVEFDENSDLKLDEGELETVANTIHASLSDFNYFQLVTDAGKDVPMVPPPKLLASFEDGQLIVLFETRPKNSLKLVGKTNFGIYDPSFYTAVEFTDDKHMSVAGLPSDCTAAVVRPNPDEAIAQNKSTLTDAFFNDPTGTNMNKIFATRLEIACKPS
jgi:ABC-type uncharacterized transport system substrate-binding protein